MQTQLMLMIILLKETKTKMCPNIEMSVPAIDFFNMYS